MAIVLLFVCFGAIFLCMGISSTGTSKTEILLRSILTFSLVLVVTTELLSAFKLISFGGLLGTWGTITISCLFYLYLHIDRAIYFIQNLNTSIRQVYISLSFYERFLIIALAILFLLEFVQGIIYPPNNLDSMTYHLARVVSWVGHHSVAPYPTHIPRQLYQPPFAEYVILNFNLLSGGDYFSASVQFFFSLFCLTVVVAIVKEIGLSRGFQLMAVLMAATIPEVVLQTSSTQNDVVASFFLLSAFYFCLKCIKGTTGINYCFLGLSAGLGIFTKGTTYMLLPPILLILGIYVLKQLFKKQFKPFFYAFLMVLALPVLINAMQYHRNYSYSGNLLGVDSSESVLYRNARMNPKLFICNAAKDIDLNMGLLCVPRITFGAGAIVHKLFNRLGVNIDDPDITFPRNKSTIQGLPGDADYSHGILVATHEDYGANLIHMLFIWISMIIIAWHIIKHKSNGTIILLAVTLIIQVAIFCGYLKFQPWGTRLQTGIFLLSVPIICYAAAINNTLKSILMKCIVPFILCYAFILTIFNFTRPYITFTKQVHAYYFTSPMPIFANRFLKIFALGSPVTAHEYSNINKDIKNCGYKNIGLMLDDGTWEYPLFTDCYKRELNPVNINVTNYTNSIKGYDIAVDCIVSTIARKPFIDYMGRRFYNQEAANKAIWYYKLRN
jgi:hypothetical protein